jgi:hypothetical protein
MEFKLGEFGNRNAMGKLKGKSLAKYLSEMLSENDVASGRPIKALLAEKAIRIALDEKTGHKDFMYLLEQFMDRETGKAVNTNINAEVTSSPLADIDTATLEAFRARLAEIKSAPKP